MSRHGFLEPSFLNTNFVEVESTWERPEHWLPIDGLVSSGEEKVVMLVAVFNGNNYIRITPAGTAFTVDWGDGSDPENFALGAHADHNFSWAGCPAETITPHGYRQAIVTITPQGSGVFGDTFGLINKHPSTYTRASTGILDIEASLPNCTRLQLGTSNPLQTNMMVQHVRFHSALVPGTWDSMFYSTPSLRLVEGLELSPGPTSTSYMFAESGIIAAPEFNTSNSTSFAYMFYAASRLQHLPDYDYSAATNMQGAFQNCVSLREHPGFNSPLVSNAGQIFMGSSILRSVGPMNLPSASSFASMFRSCPALEEVGSISSSSILSYTANMFEGCGALKNAPEFDTSGVTTASNMFFYCGSLFEIPLYDFKAVTLGSSMFYGMINIRSFPLFNFSSLVSAENLVGNCSNLTEIPAWDLSKVSTLQGAFTNCLSIVEIHLSSTPLLTNLSNTFNGCLALRSLKMDNVSAVINWSNFVGINATTNSLAFLILTGATRGVINISNSKLQSVDLDAFYTSIGSAAGSQTITVTGNPGTSGDNPTIASGKGWTVGGS